MSEIRSVVCPSGLAGEVRGLKTKEANLFTSPSFLRSGGALDQVLAACWMSTADHGIYPSFEQGKGNWGKVLVCDRFVALMHIRIATYGAQYDFGLQCTQQMCRQRFEWSVNLLDDLPVKSLPEDSKRIVAEGNVFESELAGRRVTYRLLNGDDERQASKRMAQSRQAGASRIATISLAARIIDIDGVHANDKLRWLDDLDMGDATEFIATMDESDGGVNTTIEVECPHCGAILDVDLPFDRPFWAPRKKPLTSAT
jgi:hypothetical protein